MLFSSMLIGCGALPIVLKNKSDQPDLIVVGAGHSGLAAAAAAAQKGAKVLVIEKREGIGLNTYSDKGLFASSLSPAGLPSFNDSVQNHFNQSYVAGSRLADRKVLNAFVSCAPETIAWLSKMGLRFNENPINSNSLWKRCYQPSHNGYTEILYKEAVRLGVKFCFGEKLVRIEETPDSLPLILTANNDGKLSRRQAKKGIILCSGGFGANPKLIEKFAPEYSKLPTDNEPGSSGEVLIEAQRFGVKLEGMDRIICIPRPSENQKNQAYLHLDSSRFLYINNDGKRFVSEDALRPAVTKAFFEQNSPKVFELADDEAVRSYQMDIQRDLWRGIESGSVFKAESLEELAEKIMVPGKKLLETVRNYNHFVDLKKDKDFHKAPLNLSHKIIKEPFWAVQVEMKIHETLGGLAINERCQTVNNSREPINGLYAAGAIVGNLHGNNRLGGNGISSAITLGRIAGLEVAKKEA